MCLLCMKSIFWFIYLKYASFASQFSRLNSHAVHVTSGVYEIKLPLPIQIPDILPKIYSLGLLWKSKGRIYLFHLKIEMFVLFFLCIPNEGNVRETAAAHSSLSFSAGYLVSIYKRSLPRYRRPLKIYNSYLLSIMFYTFVSAEVSPYLCSTIV